jgi:chromate reductase, NAD(P)H dehydrogenase (quinone)
MGAPMADRPLVFAGFAGSLRKGSYNQLLLRALADAAPFNVRVETMDIAQLPLFNMDMEDTPPEAVTRVRETIRKADGLIIVTPEHNGTIPAVTKNVIEWASRPSDDSVLERKPAAILGASTSYYGTLRAQAALREIATVEEIYFMVNPEIRVARAAGKFDEHGELIDDELRRELTEFLAAFAVWVRRLQV